MNVPYVLISFCLTLFLALVAVIYKLFAGGISKDLELSERKMESKIDEKIDKAEIKIEKKFDSLKDDIEKKHQHLLNNIKHIENLTKLNEK